MNDFKGIVRDDTNISTNRGCDSTYKSRTSLNQTESQGEGEVDTQSHSLLRNCWQLIAAWKQKINFCQWVTLGISAIPHRTSQMTRSSWPTQNGHHVFVCFFCFCIFVLLVVVCLFGWFLFGFWEKEKSREKERIWNLVGEEGQGYGMSLSWDRTWSKGF